MIPPPPQWLFLMLVLVGFMLFVMANLAGCAQPHRFDSLRQQQLQQQQDACLRAGGNPQQCRP
jgi:hypothetical protein